MKYVWLALFALFVGMASYFAEELLFPTRSPFKASSSEELIYQDFKELNSKNNLPPELQQVSEVFFSDHRIQKMNINWLELSKLFFPQKPEGKYELQIEAFDATDDDVKEKKDLSIFQFSLFDKKTKNKIWELSRNYIFSPQTPAPKK